MLFLYPKGYTLLNITPLWVYNLKKYLEIIPDRWYILIAMREETLKHYIGNITMQVRNLRKKNKLTQVEFAKRAGVGLRFIRELEGGKTTVRLDKLMQVLDFLGYHLELKKNDVIQFTVKHPKTDLI